MVTDEEKDFIITEELNLTKGTKTYRSVLTGMSARLQPKSLYDLMRHEMLQKGERDLLELEDFAKPTPGDHIDQERLRDHVQAAIDSFSPKHQDILRLHFGLSEEIDKEGKEHTYQEIGELYGLTKQNIQQILKKVLVKIRKKIPAEIQDVRK